QQPTSIQIQTLSLHDALPISMQYRRHDELGAWFAKGHLIIQTNFPRKLGHLRQRETFLSRGGLENLDVLGAVQVERAPNTLQRQRPATKGNLGAMLHVPQPFAGASDPFRGAADKPAAIDRLKERLQFAHPP